MIRIEGIKYGCSAESYIIFQTNLRVPSGRKERSAVVAAQLNSISPLDYWKFTVAQSYSKTRLRVAWISKSCQQIS